MTANATLRTMYDKAREASVPLDTIERAIKRGTGELEGVTYESVTYEGYAPNGVAVIVECLTDNRNRSTSEVKNIFTRNGGSLAEPGAVAWQFERRGVVMAQDGGDGLPAAGFEERPPVPPNVRRAPHAVNEDCHLGHRRGYKARGPLGRHRVQRTRDAG